MRIIKFRGKSTTDGKWVQGYLSYRFGKSTNWSEGRPHIGIYIEDNGFVDIEVDAETVGEFTGEIDMTYIPIYEGDIVNFKNFFEGIIVFDAACFCIEITKVINNDCGYNVGQKPPLFDFNTTIIGNIYKTIKSKR